MKILSYNVNGIRAAMRKGFNEWLASRDEDVVMLQEVKADQQQVDTAELEAMGFHIYWFPATSRKGYSGVATLCRREPDHVEFGCGMEPYDSEGRVLRVDFGDLSLLNTYFPSGSSSDARQVVKMEFLDYYLGYLKKLRKSRPKLVLSGDYNICHRPIDIHDPVSNKNSSGFLPEEREWMDRFFDSGWIDSFRHFHPEEPHHYSWWSYRAGARSRNKGWRIDYNAVTKNLGDRLVGADILPDVIHSDHCPVTLELAD